MVIALILAGATATLAGAGYFVWASGRRAEPVVHHARCPKCDQKVRYGPARAGQQIPCPRCRRRWTLPATGETSAQGSALPRRIA